MDSLNARVLIERIKNLDELISKRRKLASVYNNKLKILNGKYIKIPPIYSTNSSSKSTYQNYEIQAKEKEN